ASSRFASQLPPGSGDGIWYLAAAVTAAMAGGGLVLNLNRRRTLGGVERLMARFLKSGNDAFTEGSDELRREVVFLLALSSLRDGLIAEVIAAFEISAASPSDRELREAGNAMRGPGHAAIESVV